MAEQRERSVAGTRDEDTADRKQQTSLTDLDSPADEAERVKGGRSRRATSDPCEGGE